jgi:hypothetical protein
MYPQDFSPDGKILDEIITCMQTCLLELELELIPMPLTK